jgi:hypothetical protein
MVFSRDSRYYGFDNNYLETKGGGKIVYAKRRFIPLMGRDEVHQVVKITEGDRLDLLAERVVDDPEQYWHICDVNHETNPRMLLDEPGKWVRIPVHGG